VLDADKLGRPHYGVLVIVGDALSMVDALADPRALLIFGVIVADTPKAQVPDAYRNMLVDTSWLTPFGLMKQTSLSRAEVERAAARLKEAGLPEETSTDDRAND
jgi:hypothetical protein